MPNASLSVEVRPAELGPTVPTMWPTFWPPIPVPPRAHRQAASGGELSRIMLALEVVLADTDAVGTFVFDEVDAGVGGAAATAIGRRLHQLAQHAQVIVVTHMPQVAAFAGTHLRVLKQQDQNVTTSDVRSLDDDERVVEIARMLAGHEDSCHAQEHARTARDPVAAHLPSSTSRRLRDRTASVVTTIAAQAVFWTPWIAQGLPYIFVTGGVASSLGKGLPRPRWDSCSPPVVCGSRCRNFDPYLNVDPGTMNPFQHGEVFVTDDGAETDLDIGHYERFLDRNLASIANVTTGQVLPR